MKLEIGKTYRHSNPNSLSQFKIINRWSEDLYEGVLIRAKDQREQPHYMFDSRGVALGYAGHSGSNLDWSLVEAYKSYETRAFYVSSRLTPNVEDPVWYSNSNCHAHAKDAKFLVRENGDNNTIRLVDYYEMQNIFLQNNKK